jgi:2,3-bisphosphoglycerate-dependent phosphoglycerate mutase
VSETESRLVLIRHGEAYSNLEATWVAHERCRGLTSQGRTQMRTVACWLAGGPGLGVTGLLSSSTRRVTQSADLIAAALPSDVVRRADCAFCELHPPAGDGTALTVAARDRLAADAWFAPEQGESRLSYALRARRALLAAAAEFRGSTAIIVTHAGFIMRAAAFAGGAEFERVPRPANGTVTIIAVTRPGPAPAAASWRVVRYAEAVAGRNRPEAGAWPEAGAVPEGGR